MVLNGMSLCLSPKALRSLWLGAARAHCYAKHRSARGHIIVPRTIQSPPDSPRLSRSPRSPDCPASPATRPAWPFFLGSEARHAFGTMVWLRFGGGRGVSSRGQSVMLNSITVWGVRSLPLYDRYGLCNGLLWFIAYGGSSWPRGAGPILGPGPGPGARPRAPGLGRPP